MAAVAVLTAACSADPPRDATTDATPSITTDPGSATPVPTTPTAPSVSRPVVPVFRASVDAISPATAARMTTSWRPGCPVALDALRLLTATHWGFDGEPRQGELVVHADYADQIVSVFRDLFETQFPIEQMRLVDEFGADDDRSMAANNTSAFNCRRATGSERWSEHAFGRAIDINPVQNPFVTRSGAILPPAGAAHTDRDAATPGLITADGPAVAAFKAIGWGWGGDWSSGQDYQHFSATGR